MFTFALEDLTESLPVSHYLELYCKTGNFCAQEIFAKFSTFGKFSCHQIVLFDRITQDSEKQGNFLPRKCPLPRYTPQELWSGGVSTEIKIQGEERPGN